LSNTPILLTFRQFAAKHPAFSEGSLRWLRFRQHENGFARAFRAVGPNRVLIDEGAFFSVIEEQNANPGPEVAP
jgi:hypothetical protein